MSAASEPPKEPRRVTAGVKCGIGEPVKMPLVPNTAIISRWRQLYNSSAAVTPPVRAKRA